MNNIDKETLSELLAFSVFFAFPIVMNYAIKFQESLKAFINKRLAVHGLRLKER